MFFVAILLIIVIAVCVSTNYEWSSGGQATKPIHASWVGFLVGLGPLCEFLLLADSLLKMIEFKSRMQLSQHQIVVQLISYASYTVCNILPYMCLQEISG
jgi:hypothetical protein